MSQTHANPKVACALRRTVSLTRSFASGRSITFCEVENRCRSCRKRGKIVVLDLADRKNEKFQTAPARAVAAAAEAAASGAAAAS